MAKSTPKQRKMEKLPVLPLRKMVVYPHMTVALLVGRPRSLEALNRAKRAKASEILLVAQRQGSKRVPGPAGLYEVGTIATVESSRKRSDGTVRVVFSGKSRARVSEYIGEDVCLSASVERLDEMVITDPKLRKAVREKISTVKGAFERYVRLSEDVPPEMLLRVNALEDPEKFSDVVAGPIPMSVTERQSLLENTDLLSRLDKILEALTTELEFLRVGRKLKRQSRRKISTQKKQQRGKSEASHHDQQGQGNASRADLDDLVAALGKKDLPESIRERANKELNKLRHMNVMSGEATVVRNYLDWILALPWTERSSGSVDIQRASRILDDDHHGLEKVKERVVEYLAVSTLVDRMRGPILCLVGPPGVGKTSLARSIARATKRPFVRIALGGVRDEAEIRGHRRTYIGAMPGKLLHGMKRAKTIDPVILLDEIDKIASDRRGDPASALLEVLDAEQNAVFSDHYLDMDYDLSHALFLCTANTMNGIPVPLRDRLEVIELSGYTEPDKLVIGRKHLLPRQLKQHGIANRNLRISPGALRHIIRRYTREAGVRELDRKLAQICRKAARGVVDHGKTANLSVTIKNIETQLGLPRYKYGTREQGDHVGLVKGLAVSPWGGEMLNIEVSTVPGKGKLILTGRLGDWLKESGNAAFTYVRSRSDALGLRSDFHEIQDFHIHYPGNPLRTDGPSAGIAMATALVSALTGIAVRSDTAMTGEITLRGRVLPVGGLREKILAAHRGGIKKILVPEDNMKDLVDVPEDVMEELTVVGVTHMDRVLKEALSGDLANQIFEHSQSDEAEDAPPEKHVES